MKKFTIDQMKKYLETQDTLKSALEDITVENVVAANYSFGDVIEEFMPEADEHGIDLDNLYGHDFEHDVTTVEGDKIKVWFNTRHRMTGLIEGHSIEIEGNDITVNMQDPLWGCGADEEMKEVVEYLLNYDKA